MLTMDKMNWGKFASRTRKTETGSVYDRLLIGLRINSRDWLGALYGDSGDSAVAQVFILGAGNVVFTHAMEKPGALYVNEHAGAQAMVYARWYAEQAGLDVVMVDGLPTSEKAPRGGGAKITDFASACASAAAFVPTKELGL